MHGLENIETLKEKESGSLEINLECHLVIKFDLKRVWEITSGPSLTLCHCVKKFKDCGTDHIQRNQQQPRPAASAVSANGRCITASLVWAQ